MVAATCLPHSGFAGTQRPQEATSLKTQPKNMNAATRELRKALKGMHGSLSVILDPVAAVLYAHRVCSPDAMFALTEAAVAGMVPTVQTVSDKFGLSDKKATEKFRNVVRLEAARVAASRLRFAAQAV
jgi:hypothetical protein